MNIAFMTYSSCFNCKIGREREKFQYPSENELSIGNYVATQLTFNIAILQLHLQCKLFTTKYRKWFEATWKCSGKCFVMFYMRFA